jgi:hypothetical protein
MGFKRLNDLELCQHTLVLMQQAKQLEQLMRDNKPVAVAEALTKIESAARSAQWRLLAICDEG